MMLLDTKVDTSGIRTQKRLEVAALDLTGTIDQLLDRVNALAKRVRALRDTAHLHQSPPQESWRAA